MATMQDVARLANVSLSTVSYALSGTRPVSAETKQRIAEAMEELGFRRNALARGLASRRSHILGLTFPALENSLGGTVMEFVGGAAQAARDAGYHLVVWPFAPDDAQEVRDMTRQGLVDGVLVMEVRLEDTRVAVLEEDGVPFTMIGRTADPSGRAHVDIDFERTTEEAVDHLASLGHRHIAFLNHSAASRSAGYGPTVRAGEGFEAAMRKRGLEPVAVDCDESAVAGRRATQELLARHPELTAIVAMNEDATFGAVGGLTGLGLTIPTEFSVLSIVSSPRVSSMTEPALTTMHAPGAELGRLGVEALLAQIEGLASTPQPVLLTCRLEPGGSTGPAPTGPRAAAPAPA